jgi:hypothetical protein
MGGWVGPGDGLDAAAKRRNPFTAPAGNRFQVFQHLWIPFVCTKKTKQEKRNIMEVRNPTFCDLAGIKLLVVYPWQHA